jgi:hypothetical protein
MRLLWGGGGSDITLPHNFTPGPDFPKYFAVGVEVAVRGHEGTHLADSCILTKLQ